MTSEVIFKLHLDTHVITQPVKVNYNEETALNQTVAQLLGQFSTIGITQKQDDGTLKHFPAHRVKHVEVEFPRVSLASAGEVPVPNQVRL